MTKYPPCKEIKSSYTITKQDLSDKIVWSEFFELRFLWNWKAAYYKYLWIKSTIECSKRLSKEFAKQMDEETINQLVSLAMNSPSIEAGLVPEKPTKPYPQPPTSGLT